MTTFQTIEVKGQRFVLVPMDDYERLRVGDAEGLPAMPPADARGNVPAKEYILFSIARDLVSERRAAGLTQRALAKAAGVRVETLCRIESGRHKPNVRTLEKIERALQRAAPRRRAG